MSSESSPLMDVERELSAPIEHRSQSHSFCYEAAVTNRGNHSTADAVCNLPSSSRNLTSLHLYLAKATDFIALLPALNINGTSSIEIVPDQDSQNTLAPVLTTPHKTLKRQRPSAESSGSSTSSNDFKHRRKPQVLTSFCILKRSH